MAIHPINFRLENNYIEAINNFKTGDPHTDRTSKLKEIISVTTNMLRYTKKEIINYFTLEEAILIAATLNGTLYSIETISPKKMLYANIEDGILLDDLDVIYNVDKDKILEKIKNLSEFQAYTVIQMAFEYWENPTDIDENWTKLKRIFLIK